MDWADLRFFDERGDIDKTLNWLPHWRQLGCAYFLTFRLGDALPRRLLDRWQSDRDRWIQLHPGPWTAEIESEYHSRFTAAIERWLDDGHGSCLLRHAEPRWVMEQALQFFEGRRCTQISWVIMPNHIHTITVLLNDERLGKLLQSWKRFGAREINRWNGKSGTLCEKDYYDRLIRDPGHLMNCVRYIRRNPQKACLKPNEYTLWESDFAREIE